MWERITSLDNQLTLRNDVIVKISDVTHLKCLYACATNSQCVSFFYRPSATECLLIQTFHFSINFTVPASGFQYWMGMSFKVQFFKSSSWFVACGLLFFLFLKCIYLLGRGTEVVFRKAIPDKGRINSYVHVHTNIVTSFTKRKKQIALKKYLRE